MTTRENQLLRENETLRRYLGNTQSRLGGMQRTSKICIDNNCALSMLFEILSSFSESFDCLTAEDWYHFVVLNLQAQQQTMRRKYLQPERLTHPDQHAQCPSEFPNLMTTF